MLFNILNNRALKQVIAIDANEGLSDEAFELGWRVLIPAQPETRIAKSIMRRETWEWNIYLYDAMQSGETTLLVDDPRFSPFVEDVGNAEEGDEDSWMNDVLLSDPVEHEELESVLGTPEWRSFAEIKAEDAKYNDPNPVIESYQAHRDSPSYDC